MQRLLLLNRRLAFSLQHPAQRQRLIFMKLTDENLAWFGLFQILFVEIYKLRECFWLDLDFPHWFLFLFDILN